MSTIVSRATSALISGTGTITTSTSSTSVSGASTSFTSQTALVGKSLYTTADVFIGTIASVTNDTTLVLTSNAVVTISTSAYKIGYKPLDVPLSNSEIDTNFINLNNEKIETSDAVSTNTANKVVKRDASGNFSAGTIAATFSGNLTGNVTGTVSGSAGSVVNNVTFNNAGSGAASGTTFNGSSAVTISYNTIGAQVAGTYVNAVSGTSPVSSSGGTNPAISLAAGYGDTQNPFASKIANYVLAAPNGSAGAPTFRALVAADIPTLNQNTTGSAGSVANALTVGTGVSLSSGSTYNGSAALTISIGQAVATSSNVQFNSIGVNTAGSGTAGEIRATNNVTAYYSDARLKDFSGTIPNALDKVMALNGYYFTENAKAKELGYNNDDRQVGVSAQEVEAVLPEVIADAPINGNFPGADYKTVHYEKLVPLLIEAIKEQQKQIDELKTQLSIKQG